MIKLYLDTGAIALLADGQVSDQQVQRLLEAARHHQAVLLVSAAHVIDISRSDDPPTQARMAAVIEAFPFKAAVVRRPQDHEKGGLDAALTGDASIDRPTTGSLPVRPFVRWDDFMRQEGFNHEHLDAISTTFSRFGEAKNLSFEGRRIAQAPPEMEAAMPHILSALVQASSAEEFIARLAFALPHLPMAPSQVEAIWPIMATSKPALLELAAERGVTLESMVLKLWKRPEAVGADLAGIGVKGGYDRWMEVARHVAPGTWLSALLVKANVRNERRRPGMGDSADQEHVAYLPYVDVATVDAHNHAVLSTALRQHPSLSVRLLKNPTRDFAEVIEAMNAASAGRT